MREGAPVNRWTRSCVLPGVLMASGPGDMACAPTLEALLRPAEINQAKELAAVIAGGSFVQAEDR